MANDNRTGTDKALQHVASNLIRTIEEVSIQLRAYKQAGKDEPNFDLKAKQIASGLHSAAHNQYEPLRLRVVQAVGDRNLDEIVESLGAVAGIVSLETK